jgi:hypothetical protein
MALKRAPKKVVAKKPEPEEELDEPEDDEEPEDEDEEQEEKVQAKADGKKVVRTKEKKVKDPTIRLRKDPEPKYGGPQVQGILKCLEENDNELKLSELLEKLPDFIKTQQPVDRIFAFYKRNLQNAGVIEIL